MSGLEGPCWAQEDKEHKIATHRLCAERRLLQTYMEAARRKGVPAHSVVAWVRRKLGAGVLVLRRRADGTLGCAAPCVWCARELLRFDLRVHCTLGGGGFFSGRLSETGAPCPGLTGGQKRMLGKYK